MQNVWSHPFFFTRELCERSLAFPKEERVLQCNGTARQVIQSYMSYNKEERICSGAPQAEVEGCSS